MSHIWQRIAATLTSLPARGLVGLAALIEALRGSCTGNPGLRRQVAFSIAIIALSAKMAKADGVVTQAEIRAFHQIFEIPPNEMNNVRRVYTLAQADTAGFEAYASQLSNLCGSGDRNCLLLQDVLDGLFFIAEADGVVHEREVEYLHRVATIFRIDEQHFRTILARHVQEGRGNPYAILDLPRGTGFDEVKQRYRKLVSENHPDRLIARGMPDEFIAIATRRLAAINEAFEAIERDRVAA